MLKWCPVSRLSTEIPCRGGSNIKRGYNGNLLGLLLKKVNLGIKHCLRHYPNKVWCFGKCDWYLENLVFEKVNPDPLPWSLKGCETSQGPECLRQTPRSRWPPIASSLLPWSVDVASVTSHSYHSRDHEHWRVCSNAGIMLANVVDVGPALC